MPPNTVTTPQGSPLTNGDLLGQDKPFVLQFPRLLEEVDPRCAAGVGCLAVSVDPSDSPHVHLEYERTNGYP